MKTPAVDLMLRTLRLPSMLASYRRLAEQAAKEHWGYEQYLQALAEEESEEQAAKEHWGYEQYLQALAEEESEARKAPHRTSSQALESAGRQKPGHSEKGKASPSGQNAPSRTA